MIHLILQKIVNITLDRIQLFSPSASSAPYWLFMILCVVLPTSFFSIHIKLTLLLSTVLLVIFYPKLANPILMPTNVPSYDTLNQWVTQNHEPVPEVLKRELPKGIYEQVDEDAEAEFRCPITHSVPEYPIKIGEQVYELGMLKQWVDERKIDPYTNAPLNSTSLIHAMIDPETGEDKFGKNREEFINRIKAHYKP
ncbi:hypothetical protein MMH89_04550 [Candidatus Comchoanobacter bicostacola]|uniref:U-box domain-containing protein n=1 Tax=Candidatus Comchoanobacter bicostacola TaxID=2919598 RepID=A0ABY5DL10_9GAMM|nr:hypothetical protein [Candidatus Comchoanobacter bicostacola]UTC24487.1 hypothetical protein MMH89_04550 [Candidatus Comchoanobacter bicostacola]